MSLLQPNERASSKTRRAISRLEDQLSLEGLGSVPNLIYQINFFLCDRSTADQVESLGYIVQILKDHYNCASA